MEKLVMDRSYVPSNKKPVTIAILQEQSQSFDKRLLAKLSSTIAGKQIVVDLLEYVEKVGKKEKENRDLFSDKAIGWNGVVKGKGLKQFSQKEYDILISYYTSDELSLQLVTTLSQATFKVGISDQFEELNDLTIVSKIGEEELFMKELQKYLKILKIIS